MNTENLTNILLTFFTERINVYLVVACIAIIIIAIIAFFIKKKAIYPVPVSKVIGPSYLIALYFFIFNSWDLIRFIIFSIITLLWIVFLISMGFKND